MTSRLTAIPTMYAGVAFRSRLEAKWAILFDALGWRGWCYEPMDLPATETLAPRIPDFTMPFKNPTIVEVKPAFTIDEIAEYRNILVESAADWLCSDAERALRQLDAMPDDTLGQLEAIDEVIEFTSSIRDRRDNSDWALGRRALVAGSQLIYADLDGPVTLDGLHTFSWCSTCRDPHIGLYNARGCLVCGRDGAPTPVETSDMFMLWRMAGTKAQWRPAEKR